MSYILDALKKAERERHLAKIPTVNTVHRISWDRRRPIWLWIAGAAVLANVAVLIWLLRPEPARDKGTPSPPVASAPMAAAPEKPPVLVERPAAVSPASKTAMPETASPSVAPSPERSLTGDRPAAAQRQPRPEATAEPTPKPDDAKSTPAVPGAAPPPSTLTASKPKTAPTPVTPPAPSVTEKAAPSAPATAATPPAPAKPSAAAAPSVPEKPAAPPAPPRTAAAVPEKPAAPPAATAPTKPAERTGSLPALQDMSAADQEGMPKMALQVLVYSEVPAERMIYINNQKYIEGQSIEGKVAVESILPDGAILNYQGKRFKLRH